MLLWKLNGGWVYIASAENVITDRSRHEMTVETFSCCYGKANKFTMCKTWMSFID